MKYVAKIILIMTCLIIGYEMGAVDEVMEQAADLY